MEHIKRLEDLIKPVVEAMGYELVRLMFMGKGHPTLQIMVERLDKVAMNVDDCSAISRSVSAILDVEDPIHSSYILEVSSPGIDRPLIRLADFQQWAGFEAKIEVDPAVEQRRRFRGRLLGVDENELIGIKVETGEVKIAHHMIRSAKLVLTDDLIAMVLRDNREI